MIKRIYFKEAENKISLKVGDIVKYRSELCEVEKIEEKKSGGLFVVLVPLKGSGSKYFVFDEDVSKIVKTNVKPKTITEADLTKFKNDLVSVLPSNLVTYAKYEFDNDNLNYWIGKRSISINFVSGLRGSRIDHGGGDSGDEWMDDEQVNNLTKSYKSQLQPTLDKIKKGLESKGWSEVETGIDYGEKGHVSINVTVGLSK